MLLPLLSAAVILIDASAITPLLSAALI